MIKFKFWVCSSVNHRFSYDEEFTLDDLGYEEQEWNNESEESKDAILEAYCRDLLFNRYIEYGYSEVTDE